MKHTFVILGTLTEFSFETPILTTISEFTYMGIEYDCKVSSIRDNEVLYHLTKKDPNRFSITVPPLAPEDWFEEGKITYVAFIPGSSGYKPPTETHFAPDCKITIQSSASQLKQQLAAAIQSENYELAAELRDKLSKI